MKLSHRSRRILFGLLLLGLVGAWLVFSPKSYETTVLPADNLVSPEDQTLEPLGVNNDDNSDNPPSSSASAATQNSVSAATPNTAISYLEKLEIKGRAPKTGYSRSEFYTNWPSINGCSLRQIIIKRELGDNAVLEANNCDVHSGTFTEPYTGSQLTFYQKSDFSKKIQIDHIVALSDAWQKGAQYKTKDERYQIATDPLNLIAADASANQQKSDGDAATWLPPNKAFRCQYVARQVSVKYKYGLWITQAEHDAIANVLQNCPNEPVVGV